MCLSVRMYFFGLRVLVSVVCVVYLSFVECWCDILYGGIVICKLIHIHKCRSSNSGNCRAPPQRVYGRT